jgi:N-acetylglucosamine kinase-like BadF-type ATPase
LAIHQIIPGIYIGVDSGGTRTNVAIKIVHPDGKATDDSYESRDSLSGALPIELIPGTLGKILAPLESRIGAYEFTEIPAYLWISAAGFTPWTRDNYLVAMNNLISTLLGGSIRCAGIANDGVSLLLGSRAHVIIIAGTGSTVLVRATNGQLHQAGGHEWVASDDGSGFWIGMRAIREAYRDHEAGVDSVLLQRFRELYGIRSDDGRRFIEKIRDLAIGDKDTKKEIARFAASVCAAAERGDKGAQNIVKSEAEGLADVAAELLRRRFTSAERSNGLRIVQCGNLLANEFYSLSFEGQLERRLLSDSQHKARFDRQRVITGGDAAVRLAGDLVSSPDQLLELDLAFRPAIAQR